MTSADSPAQFYTGLVADLYEPLASERARAEDYVPFLQGAGLERTGAARSGARALELACGTGLPMLDLVERGYAVEGLDASHDMLDRCRERAAERGLDVTLHHGEMQSFSLPGRYRSIFLAGASFTLLTTDAHAERALERIYAHLEPGGSALIPLEIERAESHRPAIGRTRETTSPKGDRLRVSLTSVDTSDDGRTLQRLLRYERVPACGEPEIVERVWQTRWWSQEQFRQMLEGAGFGRATIVAPGGGRADPDARVFVALAQRGRAD